MLSTAKDMTNKQLMSDDPIRAETGVNAVRLWLLLIALLVYAMILVGGATRLTDSGLSITEWKPVTGALPPLSDSDWVSEFEKYRADTAEYRLQNHGMSMEEFKFIYWWEWGHRLLGRIVGVAFLFPFLAFWALGWTTPRLRKRLCALFLLGGLQGAIGWWMVASGVGDTDRVDVAAYRLMTHFSLALIIICGCVWVWLEMGKDTSQPDDRKARPWAVALLLLCFLQMLMGALVAGLDAGRDYTDWPLMGGEIVPQLYWRPELGLANLIENSATAQFNHRLMAYIMLGFAYFVAWKQRGREQGRFTLFAAVLSLQAALGIVTLFYAVPLELGLMHQALGTIVLLLSVVLVWRTSAPVHSEVPSVS